MASKVNATKSRWLEDEEEDFIDCPPFSDDDEIDNVEEQLESSGSDTSSEPEEGIDLREFNWEKDFYGHGIPSPAYFSGEDGTMWFKNQTCLKKTSPKLNIRPGPRAGAKSKKTPLDCLSLFFDDNVIDLIVRSTNERIKKEQLKYSRESDAKLTTDIEIRALLGILYLSGSLKSNKEHFLQLFEATKGTGMEAIYLTMTTQRYKFLMRNIRFDDPATNADSTNEDKLGPIRELFELILNNFQTHYIASGELNMGKRLIPFRGRCNFRLHVPKKSTKQGIRVFTLVDCQCPYTVNLEVYMGDNPGPYQVNYDRWAIPARLTVPVQGENRNVTMNNYFSSIMTVEKLIVKKTTMVATIKKDLKEIPAEFRQCKNKAATTSQFGFHDIATLVQFIPEEDKFNLLISSRHTYGFIDDSTGEERVPEIITYYNRTKYGVDLVDKMCAMFDVSRFSRRWPLAIFFDLMNLIAINALCVYTANMSLDKVGRREFLTEMALNMMKPLALRRLHNDFVSHSMKLKLSQFLEVPYEPLELTERATTAMPDSHGSRQKPRGRCYMCARKRQRVSRITCQTCKKYICSDHYEYVCFNCLGARLASK